MAEKPCSRIYCIIAQILVLGSVAFVNASYENINFQFKMSLLSLFCSYLYLLTVNYLSEHWEFLSNIKPENSVENYLSSQFNNPPRITWKYECYHHVGTGKNSRRLVTKTDSKCFSFYTWKDISGIFHLDSEKVKNSSMKAYVKLDLEVDFDLIDDITKLDYQTAKDAYYQQNRNFDTCFDFKETRDMLNYNEYNLIKIGNFGAFGVNKCMFIIFTFFIPIVEFYKIYIDFFCIEQKFTIKKILSSRYDVNANKDTKYESLKPTLIIFKKLSKVLDFIPDPLHQNPQLPSLDELNYARRFSETAFTSFNAGKDEEYKPHFGNHNLAPVFSKGNQDNQNQSQITNLDSSQRLNKTKDALV